ncbi:MAG TPA: mandelate racemase/muconate lactonizing enzyme family protein [Bradyrhizobium sp.]|uniref:mandelate racemase/muconate lactonizing enzyme family protein n=1 Tax=Bradyrhizobium sp. TaxID=376 RepID=UPI002D7E4B6D|nr:mandelate racemase/muconate lactonizing enzyme family protein [Bradyrhizobium sp.]HET7885740.1 mandelate racemase/muconate lactonizing enzyme family protein [Bradyrhizobium sp.]
MKIEHIKVDFVRLPEEEPLVGAPFMIGMMREFFTVQVQTDEGLEGIGVTAFAGKLVRSLRAALEELGEVIKGEDPLRVEQVNAKMRVASASCGSGIAMLAISAIDTALWDLRGKAFNVSLARLLGGTRDKVPAYASGALSRTTPTDKLQRAASALVEKGYRQIKTQMAVAGLSPKQEIERIRLVREAVGPEVNLMVDINQRWSVAEVISIGHQIEDLRLGWLEDPTTCDDHQGHAKIADALSTPVCAGEYLWGIEPHRQALAHHASDITMIDLLRVGGVTQWMKVAGMAEAFNKPVASHLLPEIHVHLIAAIPNGLVVEYMPWTWRLFENPPIPVNGEIAVPPGAGLGLKFAPDLFEKYGIS